MNKSTHHRLVGLEPDNLLAFLALLGLIRTLECTDLRSEPNLRFHPRAYWDLDTSPLRPVLCVARSVTREEITAASSDGLLLLVSAISVGNRKDLNYPRSEVRVMLEQAADAATLSNRDTVDLLACLMSDAAVKPDKKSTDSAIDPTPLCLLFGQGHQHFLERLDKVPADPAPPPRGRNRAAIVLTAAECIAEALFEPWHRNDPTWSFRWDPEEDVRYALMAGNPTDPTYKGGTQHGANRLAAVGLAALTLVPETRAGRVRPAVLGGTSGADGFSFSWPIWKEPATLSGIRALLGHPELRNSGALMHLGVDHVLTTRRISVGKFMNFTRARTEMF
jgi:hypothetical protein